MQREINNYIIDTIYNQINPEMDNMIYHSRLRTCSAWVYETEHFYILRSYNTFVASYNKETHEFIDFLRYVYGFTHTSASHVAKFYNDFARKGNTGLRFCEIPLKLSEKLDAEMGV